MAGQGCIDGTGKPELTFVLVHGTFGRGAPWVASDADGSFRRQLRRAFEGDFDVHFEVVDWGEPNRLLRLVRDNTLERRFEGAAQLVRHLRNCAAASATDRRYLVAHSHGGSVVMYALNQQEILNKVTGVVCLSSPFLHYQHAAFHRDLLFFSLLMLLFVATDVGGPLLWAYTGLYTLVVATVLVAGNLGQGPESAERIAAQRVRVKIPAQQELQNDSGPIPFLAVRPHRDEVTMLFWFTQNAGRAFRALWQFVNTVGRWALPGFILVRGIQWGIESWLPRFDIAALDNAMSLIDRHFLVPITLAATAVLLGMVVMRMSYAFDSLPWLARLDLRAEILPWEGADVVAVDTFGGLAHCSVQRQAPPKIIDWIRRSHRIDPKDRISPKTVAVDKPETTADTPERPAT